jgi:hypothetical protein
VTPPGKPVRWRGVAGVLAVVDVFVGTVRRQVVPVDAVFSHHYLKLIPFPVRSFILPESRTVEVGPPPPLCSLVWIACLTLSQTWSSVCDLPMWSGL